GRRTTPESANWCSRQRAGAPSASTICTRRSAASTRSQTEDNPKKEAIADSRRSSPSAPAARHWLAEQFLPTRGRGQPIAQFLQARQIIDLFEGRCGPGIRGTEAPLPEQAQIGRA